MRQRLVAGNWKMHGTQASVTSLVGGLLEARSLPCQVLIFPPVIFLEQVQQQLAGRSDIVFGAQNGDWHDSGAYTGEVSMLMLQEFGCSHVLVGHSERRSLFGETSEQVARKAQACLATGMVPVLCVGESLAQRHAGETAVVVESQLQAVISDLGIQALGQMVIAYEPVWAIGTGESATPEQAEAVHVQIRMYLANLDVNISKKIQILYGGSVNATNATELFAQENIDGALVGGASLKAEDFLHICRATA
ncbi:MAG: triosephosphate isomerase [Candidatus Azotimanducaceae bacterium]|jgi:triosephosphate isomerase